MPSPNDPTPIALPYLATHRRASAVAALIVEAIPDLSGDGGTMIRVVMESAAPHDIAQLTAQQKADVEEAMLLARTIISSGANAVQDDIAQTEKALNAPQPPEPQLLVPDCKIITAIPLTGQN